MEQNKQNKVSTYKSIHLGSSSGVACGKAEEAAGSGGPRHFQWGVCYKYNNTFYNNFFLVANKSIK